MRLLLMTLLVIVVATPAMAPAARIASFGGMPVLVEDDTDIFLFPTALSKYRNFAVAELRGVNTPFANRAGGVSYYVERFDADVGIFVNRDSPWPWNQYGYQQLQNPNQEHLLLVSKNGLAGGIGIGADSYDTSSDPEYGDGTVIKESASNLSFHGGYNAEFDNSVAELGAHFWTGSSKQEIKGDAPDIEDSNSRLVASARVKKDRGNGTSWIGAALFESGSGTLKNDGGADNEAKTSVFSFALAGAVRMDVSKKTSVFFGLIPYATNTVETEDLVPTVAGPVPDVTTTTTFTMTAMPVLFFAMETQIRSWFTGWIGVNKYMNTGKFENKVDDGNNVTGDETTNRSAPFVISLGGSVQLSENFRIDGSLNPNWLFIGPNFLSGGAQNLTNQISVVGTW